ncbi:MSMEG_0565 family glycosyltransferase [Ancylobacter sp. G4_0304]|uniref:MSMEG_0565 family glycosyltransferase n=1 Tax=Ancylobacter sp. G4_0304 TaxID=3114289 RepID=UPI0039C70B88
MNRLRIAILTHSTNPRGGVVHALELAEALTDLGHDPVVHAPDAKGTGFFRPARCGVMSVEATPFSGGMTEMVETRIADYVRHFERPGNRRFDVFHAQDGISGNALATLKNRGLITRFARTVHHVDDFSCARLSALQHRAIVEADAHFTVSRMWQAELGERYGLAPVVVGNGVDIARFSPERDGSEPALRARLGLGAGPVILSVGGIEARKNTLRLLEAFAQFHVLHPQAQLVIAGGATVLDHEAYRTEFFARLKALGLPAHAVIETGPLAQADMPTLYRLADLLAFPSIKEGFGLVVLEAMASGVPVVVSHVAPFTEHLADEDVVWCDPFHAGSIANAMATALTPALAARLRRRGPLTARRHDWADTARAHVATYARLRENAYA